MSNDMIDFISCPITQSIFKNPVKASDGHTYEKEAIEKWFSQSSTSPMTRCYISTKELIPDHSMKSLVQKFIEKNPQYKPIECKPITDNLIALFWNGKHKDLLNYKGFKLTTQLDSRKSLMEYLSKIPDFDVFKHVYENAKDHDLPDQEHNYLIHYVTEYSPLTFIKYLHEHSAQKKCNFNVLNKHNEPVLHIAAAREDDIDNKILNYLVSIGHVLKNDNHDNLSYNQRYDIYKDTSYVNQKPYEYRTLLHCAMAGKKKDLVEKLWDKKSNVQEYNYYRARPIHLLAKYMPYEIINNLDTYTEHFDTHDCKDCHFIHYMLNNGNRDLAIIILNLAIKNTKIMQKLCQNCANGTAIAILINNYPNDLEIMQMIFQNNANLLNGNPVDLITLIRLTSQDTVLNHILTYIKANNCHNVKGYCNYRPINYFLTYKKPDWIILKYFEMISDHSMVTTYGDSILTYIIMYKPHLLDQLVKRFNLNLANKAGIQPLHEAARYIGLVGMIPLIANGANINAKTKEGRPPLSYLVKYHYNDVIPFLKKYPEVEVNTIYSNGLTLMHDVCDINWSCTDTMIDIIQLMITLGAKTEYYGKMNLVYDILRKYHNYCGTSEYDKKNRDDLSKIIKLIGIIGLDYDLPLFGNSKVMVRDKLKFFGLSTEIINSDFENETVEEEIALTPIKKPVKKPVKRTTKK